VAGTTRLLVVFAAVFAVAFDGERNSGREPEHSLGATHPVAVPCAVPDRWRELTDLPRS
jgi:hypothetical protein